MLPGQPLFPHTQVVRGRAVQLAYLVLLEEGGICGTVNISRFPKVTTFLEQLTVFLELLSDLNDQAPLPSVKLVVSCIHQRSRVFVEGGRSRLSKALGYPNGASEIDMPVGVCWCVQTNNGWLLIQSGALRHGGKETTSAGVLPRQTHHGLICGGAEPSNPALAKVEPCKPILVDLTIGLPLCQCSRIDYGNKVEVPHDRKVCALGKVNTVFLPVLATNINTFSKTTSSEGDQSGQKGPRDTNMAQPSLETGKLWSKTHEVLEDPAFARLRSFARDIWIFKGQSDDRVRAGALLDTGADANFVSQRLVSQLPVQKQEYHGNPIFAADGSPVDVEGVVNLQWRFRKRSMVYTDRFLVVDELGADIIIGDPILTENGFCSVNDKLCMLTFKKQSNGTLPLHQPA